MTTTTTASSYAASSFYVRNKLSRHMVLAGGQYEAVRGDSRKAFAGGKRGSHGRRYRPV